MVKINMQDLIGQVVGVCPKCGHTLYRNALSQEWCSNDLRLCNYGWSDEDYQEMLSMLYTKEQLCSANFVVAAQN